MVIQYSQHYGTLLYSVASQKTLLVPFMVEPCMGLKCGPGTVRVLAGLQGSNSVPSEHVMIWTQDLTVKLVYFVTVHKMYQYIITLKLVCVHRSESPTPSLLSMKSDRSKARAPVFSNEPRPLDTQYVNPYLSKILTTQYTLHYCYHYTILTTQYTLR